MITYVMLLKDVTLNVKAFVELKFILDKWRKDKFDIKGRNEGYYCIGNVGYSCEYIIN